MTHHITALSVTNNICVFCQSSYCSFNKSLSLFPLSLGPVYRLQYTTIGVTPQLLSHWLIRLLCVAHSWILLLWTDHQQQLERFLCQMLITWHCTQLMSLTERKYQNLELLCSNNIHHGKFSGNWSCPKFWLALAACKAVSEPRKSVKIWLKRENKRGLLKSSRAYLGILPADRFTKSHFFNLAHHSQGQISEDLKDLRGIWWIDYLSQPPWLGIKSQRTRHFYQDSRGA